MKLKKKIGPAIKKAMDNKGVKSKDLAKGIMAPQQMSQITSGRQVPMTDNFMLMLSKLNLKYDEFVFLMDEEYFAEKERLGKEMAEAAKKESLNRLQKVESESRKFYEKYQDVYFYHNALLAKSARNLIRSNYDFEVAKEGAQPIKDYLNSVESYNYYEIALLINSLFILDVNEAIQKAQNALFSINRRRNFFENHSLDCLLFNNLAVMCLNHPENYQKAATYAQKTISLAAETDDITNGLTASILNQLAQFKLDNGLYDSKLLNELVNTYRILGKHRKYESVKEFVEKHGVELDV